MIVVGECRVSANSQTHTTLWVFEINKYYLFHRRNHERYKSNDKATQNEWLLLYQRVWELAHKYSLMQQNMPCNGSIIAFIS